MYQPVKCTIQESPSPAEMRKSGPIGLIIASMFGVIIWLIFILFYALYWSSNFSLFQNIVVFIVSLAIMALVIGMLWMIFGARRYRMWEWNDHY